MNASPRYRPASSLSTAGCIALVIAMPLLIIYSTVISAYAIATMWAWFVVPTFGLPALSLPLAAGLRLVFDAFRGYRVEPDKKSDDGLGAGAKTAVAVLAQTVFVLFTLGAGWIIKTWWLA